MNAFDWTENVIMFSFWQQVVHLQNLFQLVCLWFIAAQRLSLNEWAVNSICPGTESNYQLHYNHICQNMCSVKSLNRFWVLCAPWLFYFLVQHQNFFWTTMTALSMKAQVGEIYFNMVFEWAHEACENVDLSRVWTNWFSMESSPSA